ncbi:MAG: hypothetical protein M3384_03595 [Acidobacteriota bacterium]|nr:hypothetical protein [Acidobacteriota bacterium]
MIKRYTRSIFSRLLLLLLLLGSTAFIVTAQQQQQRRLLYPDPASVGAKPLSPKLQEIVELIGNPKTRPVDYDKLSRTTDFFVRIAPRAGILTPDNHLLDSGGVPGRRDALLGGRPFVFLTSPESIYGRSLPEIYSDIGYEAEDIIGRQRNVDMVAVVFRYGEDVSPALDVRDGNLPRDWNFKVYIPYWDNMFSLFYRLSEKAGIDPENKNQTPTEKIFFRSEAEKAFVLCYSAAASQRIKKLSYSEIRAGGGADWVYRKLLEDKLAAFEHFRGDGRTQNEILDPEGDKLWLVEFIGPNRKLKDLPELAVIHLGRLVIEVDYNKDK